MPLENLLRFVNKDRGDNEEETLKRSEIILEIKNNGLDDEKTLNLFSEYCKNKKEKFEKENPETAGIEMARHLADIYFEIGFTDIAMDNLANAEEEAKKINNEDLLKKIEEQKSLMRETLKM